MFDTESDSNHNNVGADGGNNWEKAWIVATVILDATRCTSVYNK